MARTSHPRLRVLPPDEAIRRISNTCDRTVRMVVEQHGAPVTCQAGCSHCCRQPVFITPLEGLAIRNHLRREGREAEVQKRVDGYLAALSERPLAEAGIAALLRVLDGVGKGPSPAQRQAVYGPACPFLRDGMCSIYPVRPLMCREHISFDAVARCERDEPFHGLEKPRFDEVSSYLTRNVAGKKDRWRPVWEYERAADVGEKLGHVREKDLEAVLRWKVEP